MSRGRVDYRPLTRFGREAYARLSRIRAPMGVKRGNQWAASGSPGAHPITGGGPSTSSPSA